MGIESYGTTNEANETWSCDECWQEYDLDHYNDIKEHIWTHTDPPMPDHHPDYEPSWATPWTPWHVEYDPPPRSYDVLPVGGEPVSSAGLARTTEEQVDHGGW